MDSNKHVLFESIQRFIKDGEIIDIAFDCKKRPYFRKVHFQLLQKKYIESLIKKLSIKIHVN